MLRYARAAIGLIAAIFVAAFVHSLLAPRLAEGAYGAAGESGWLTFVVDLLAFGGTWVTVVGLLANRAVGTVLQTLLEGSGHGLAAVPTPVARAPQTPQSAPAKERGAEGWTTSEQLAGRLAMKALKGGNASEYLRAFRLLHPGSDAALAQAMPTQIAAAPNEAPAPKSRTTRGK